jgi:hypothetical protein
MFPHLRWINVAPLSEGESSAGGRSKWLKTCAA